ncbi:tetraspanin-1-like [Myxocyprinus asiaticus]|uniref:tetraspanin-1-like n=1 Tax=Myxocyprinus asiaticus TaxID=70543 RepID=UPI0022214100|nr:tetraspanin-1-like [Myxocyprinus asiaticus]
MFHTVLVSSNLLIAGGCFLFFMGLVGCCGTLKKKSWMFLAFFFTVLIIFILQVIWAVFILLPNSLKEKSLSTLETKVVESTEKNYEPNIPFISIWDETMNKEKSSYPTQSFDRDSETPCEKEEAVHKGVRGCYQVLSEENIPASGALSFLMGIIEIVAVVVSLKVYQCLKHLPSFPD